MMKVVSKFALVGAVAALVVAGSAADALARSKKAAPAPAACSPWTYKAAACTGNACSMQRCGWDRKWYSSIAWCWKPFCPA